MKLDKPQMKLDLDLVFFDFAALYLADKQRAVAGLQVLLLDEKTCRARVEFLRLLQTRGDRAWPQDDFREVIHTLTTVGTLPALERGLLAPEQLAALSCQPDALWQAHLALTADEEMPEPPPPPSGETAVLASDTQLVPPADTGFTDLLDKGKLNEFENLLQRWLPAVLLECNLDVELADDCVRFVLERLPERGQRRFRDVLPGWLEAFARSVGRGEALRLPDDWTKLVERGAVRVVLRQQPAGEAPWQRRFRSVALDRGVATLPELLRVQLAEPEAQSYDVAGFRRQLLFEIHRERELGSRWFELN